MKLQFTHTFVRSFRLVSTIFSGLILLSGCSDLLFVNSQDKISESDPREDILLTNLSAELTSGGLALQTIKGTNAKFSTQENQISIDNIDVFTYGEEETTQSITQSNFGSIYLADNPASGRNRKDIEFSGDVLHRSPMKDNPSSDSLQLRTEKIIWDDTEAKFLAPDSYEMLLSRPGQKTIRQLGKGFEATQDLKRFVVRSGVVTSDLENDPRRDQKKIVEELSNLADEFQKEDNNTLLTPNSQ